MNKVCKVPIGGIIGIIGGGQLGKMLSLSASQLGFKTHIFDPDPEAPAKQVTNISSTFPYDDRAALKNFSDSVDVVTFEFENIPKESIKICQRFSPVFPDADSLSICQDRINEKRFLNDINIPFSPFVSGSTVSEILQKGSILQFPLVLKSSRFGYDGKGQRIIYSKQELKNSETEFKNTPIILENFIDFKLEISVIICRDMFGNISAYDPAENSHQNGILVESKVPANISFSLASDAILIASKIVNALQYVGVMGVEFFVTNENKLLVNELAPRVHNSGHWTQSGCLINQFEQHIRAITGWTIGGGKRHSDVTMTNLLGSVTKGLKNKPDSSVNIYGKVTPREGRKMGHINNIN
jgi:5-(carboxyamino)imidazole ribonucleotide synthase